MKFETLHTSRNRKIVIGTIVFCVLAIVLVLSTTRAKYRVTQSIPLVRGTISYSPGDVIVEAYVNGTLASNFPEKGTVTFNNVSCSKNVSATFDKNSWSLDIVNINEKGINCKIYFSTDVISAKDYIMAGKTISERTDFSTTLETDTTGTIYKAQDNDGDTYYYAGAPTDNWFYFGGYYWRIIRINGDGTVRMIYNGTTTAQTGETTQIGTSSFNDNYNDNAYVGYMYTSGQVHGKETNSTIKGVLDTWYNNNLSSYSDSIATIGGATFCNDRQSSTSDSNLNSLGGTGTEVTYYAARIRLYAGNSVSNAEPSFKCADSNDRFNTPIGLITADEAVYAGGVIGVGNSGYYLYTGQSYWTMTPWGYDDSIAYVFYMYSWLRGSNVSWSESGVRPVINLKADINLTGNGTIDNPYKIKPSAKDTILANKTISTRTDFSTTLETDTTGTIFKAQDDDGDTYYYAGAPTDNWVKFGKWASDTPDVYYGYYSDTSNSYKEYSSLSECQTASNYNVNCTLVSNAGKDMYWRIIRINGDNSVRLIYVGTDSSKPNNNDVLGRDAYNTYNENIDNAYLGYMYGDVDLWADGGRSASTTEKSITSTTTNYQFAKSISFNTNNGQYTLTGTIETGTWDSKYQGYYTCFYSSDSCSTMYYIDEYVNETTALVYTYKGTSAGNTTYTTTHANIHSSTIKNKVDEWYQKNLIGYDEYIDKNAGFCNDRSIYSGTGAGKDATYYSAYNRLITNKQPSLSCKNKNDLFTTEKSSKGNNSLTYPIGLITADEVSYAGGANQIKNEAYYLNIAENYWTMTPTYGPIQLASILFGGHISYGNPSGYSFSGWAIIPVINLRNDVELSGSGTASDPYVIEGAE